MSSELVLVTGAGGFLGSQIVSTCLKNGYKVRGTVRDLKDERKTRPLYRLEPWANLELVEADLLDKSSWESAMRGVDYVIHVASPYPGQNQQEIDQEDEVVRPALKGTKNVMQAAFRHQVKRLVLTSSIATFVGYEREKHFTEDDWPDMDKVSRPYVKSKILAEKAAWDFVEEKKANSEHCFELAVINPSFILGPTLHENPSVFGTSESLIYRIVSGELKKVPFFSFGACDVRDVALAHVRALKNEAAVGNRHPIVAQHDWVSMKYIGDILYEEFYDRGYPVPVETEPGVPTRSSIDNARMVRELKIAPITIRQSLIDMVERFIELGILKKRPGC